MTYLLDTDHCIALEREDEAVARRLRSLDADAEVTLSVVTHAEMLYGILRMPEGRRREAARRLHDASVTDFIEVVPVTATVAEHCAEIRHVLSLAGTPIPVNDLWIAAVARANGLVLVTHDQHFRHVPGIMLEDSLSR